jgi:site-specific DNA-methyltransferase (adenine-specific)
MSDPIVYTGPGWEIRCGKWQDSPPESVDVVISDPPYDERTHKNRRRGMTIPYRHGKEWSSRSGGFSQADPVKSFDPVNPCDVGPPLIGLSSRWVILFCSVEQLGRYQDACGDNYIRGGIWSKLDPTPQFSGDRPGMFGEGVAILHRKGRKRWNGGGHCARWRYATEAHFSASDIRVHETQKPTPLMLDLVRLFSDPGELVYDPYCGSGTTGVACLRLGRRFLGHEMQPHYAEIAAERLRAENLGQTLQDYRRGQTSLLERMGDDDDA